YQGDPAQVRISEEETDYVLQVVNAHFKQQLSRDDILHTYSGVRPLCDDESDQPSAITRDYTLSLSGTPGEAPLLSVFGGKLTTYRKLAESAMELLAPSFPHLCPAWTAKAPLPGGENMDSRAALVDKLIARFGWLDRELARRWASTYGSRTWQLLDGVQRQSELGDHLGAGLYTREVDYLRREEWAMEADDILWRRTKLGLFMTPGQQARLRDYLSDHPQALPASA
ncbi:MAG TPA: glycerol-3-phosphate dehydrogenase C-terminal domain-containing protein, partial [Pseudomonas sp.]|nr:glycerol-3-phosphate dehydrogenase C-terminal domain-containing protein [Pseudomonas sp.]